MFACCSRRSYVVRGRGGSLRFEDCFRHERKIPPPASCPSISSPPQTCAASLTAAAEYRAWPITRSPPTSSKLTSTPRTHFSRPRTGRLVSRGTSLRARSQNSLCFAVLSGHRQIGFARVITDKATFAYLADVYVLQEHRGKGLAKRLLAAIGEHPELQGLRRKMLVTRDAHDLYTQFGFKSLAHSDRFMEAVAPNAYRPNT